MVRATSQPFLLWVKNSGSSHVFSGSSQEILTRFAMSSYYKQPATQTQYVKDSVLMLQMNTRPHKKYGDYVLSKIVHITQ